MAEEKKPLIEVKNLKKYFQVGSGKTDVEKVPLVP